MAFTDYHQDCAMFRDNDDDLDFNNNLNFNVILEEIIVEKENKKIENNSYVTTLFFILKQYFNGFFYRQ